jgi:hypothetical protein
MDPLHAMPARRIIPRMSKLARRLLISASVLLVLALLAFAARRDLQRVAAAVVIARAHDFTPPPPLPGESRWTRSYHAAQFYWDFSEIPIARNSRLKKFNPTLRPLVEQINRRQAAGEDMHYSMHIYREIRWLLNFTPATAATRTRIEDLKNSLDQPDLQKLAAQQQPSDGSWAMGIDTWYLRLYYSVDQLKQCQAPPRYPITLLDHINSPQRLQAQLDSALYDRFTQTGIFNREELDETFSALARLLYTDHPITCYKFDPQLPDALLAYVNRWQNPVTGCWGQWLVDRHGRVWKMDDMGITFHVVSDLHGQVQHQDMIARRLLQLDRVNFPAGILFDGHYENHLNMDAVKIFRSAWSSLDEATRRQASAEINRMLEWCLTKSLQPDGSFKVSDLDDTSGDAFRYGVWFLQLSGYFQPKDRFWTNHDFPESAAVRKRIESRLQAIGLNDPALKEAYDTLHAMD